MEHMSSRLVLAVILVFMMMPTEQMAVKAAVTQYLVLSHLQAAVAAVLLITQAQIERRNLVAQEGVVGSQLALAALVLLGKALLAAHPPPLHLTVQAAAVLVALVETRLVVLVALVALEFLLQLTALQHSVREGVLLLISELIVTFLVEMAAAALVETL
jgi:hypothetical protein